MHTPTRYTHRRPEPASSRWTIPLLLLAACAGFSVVAGGCVPATAAGRAARPTLGEVVQRIDVGRVLACAGQPDRWRCLGAEAASAALELAADKAEAAARAAQDALSGAGADDVDEDALAAELDAALLELGQQVAKAGAQ